MRATGLILGCLAVAAASALLVAPAPAYDPWSWLLWGREIAHGTLSTSEGPAFKPLPVAVTTLLAPLGDDAAPVAWVVLARAASVLAVALAFVTGRRLGGPVAGGLAAVGVALCGAFPTYAASGDVTGLFVALALAGVLAWWAGRPGVVVACALACALLRVEAWPFAAALAIVLWRREPRLRAWLVGAAVAVPVAWFVPEWLGSGDLLRSGGRARIPNPGQPAEAGVPSLASAWDAVRLPLWPLLAGTTGLALGVVTAMRGFSPGSGPGHRPEARHAAAIAAAGTAWIVLVALLAEVGFSGEARYALPGAALVAVAGAVALAGLPRILTVACVLVVAVAAVPRVADLGDVRADQRHKWRLAQDLRDAIELSGGRAAVVRCGTPYVGPYRGPLLAYRLDARKEDVEPDATPRPPGVVFVSRLHRDAPPTPSAHGFDRRLHHDAWQPPRGIAPARGAGEWEVFARCG